jgi:hypothetical protein
MLQPLKENRSNAANMRSGPKACAAVAGGAAAASILKKAAGDADGATAAGSGAELCSAYLRPDGPCLVSGVPGRLAVDRELGMASRLVFETMVARQNMYRTYDPKADYVPSRRVLVDWIADVGGAKRFGLHKHTLHVAVAYLDRALQLRSVPRDQLLLVAVCCLMIAAKCEEMETRVPTVWELSECTNGAYSADRIAETEVELLRLLDWRLTEFSALHFLGYFLHRGVLFSDDRVQGVPLFPKVDRYIRRHVDFFADFALQRYEFERFSSQAVAAAIIVVSRQALQVEPAWRPELEALTGLPLEAVRPCRDMLRAAYQQVFPSASSGGARRAREKVPATPAENKPKSARQISPMDVAGVGRFA